jgi:hypothetical protein
MKRIHRTGRIREDEGITLAELDMILAADALKEKKQQLKALVKEKEAAKKKAKPPTLKGMKPKKS